MSGSQKFWFTVLDLPLTCYVTLIRFICALETSTEKHSPTTLLHTCHTEMRQQNFPQGVPCCHHFQADKRQRSGEQWWVVPSGWVHYLISRYGVCELKWVCRDACEEGVQTCPLRYTGVQWFTHKSHSKSVVKGNKAQESHSHQPATRANRVSTKNLQIPWETHILTIG